MLGFGFSSFGYTNPETIEKLVAREDLTIEELLDEDNIVQEVKGASEKYPFIASEIFYSEIDGIVNAFFGEKPNSTTNQENPSEDHEPHEGSGSDRNPNEENPDSPENGNSGDGDCNEGLANPYEKGKEEEGQSPSKFEEEEKKNGEEEMETELFHYLFEFLAGEKKLNVTSLGYFAKVVNALLNKRFMETLHFMAKNYEILQNMFNRIGYKSIGDILGRIILMDIPYLEDYNSNNRMLFPTLRRKLLAELLYKFASSENPDELQNIVFILSELLLKYDRINYSQKMVEHLLGLDIECFFVCLKNDSSPKPGYALTFLGTLLEFFLQKTEQQTGVKKIVENEVMDSQPIIEISLPLFNSRLKPLLECYAPSILQLLTHDPENPDTIETMDGGKIKPIKGLVMREVEVLNLLLRIEGLNCLASLIGEIDVFSILWELMIRHEWNNLLHGKIEKILLTVLRSGNVRYLEMLFEKSRILDKIIDAMEVLEFVMPGVHARKLKKGYIGFITIISNEIVNLALVDEYIKKQIKTNNNWEKYEENVLKGINSNNNRFLADIDPRKPNSFDLNMENFPLYFQQKQDKEPHDDQNEEEEEDVNDREDIHLDSDQAFLVSEHYRANLNNFMSQHAEGEEVEENIPEEDKEPDVEHEPFCLRDHLEIEELENNEENEKKNKLEEEEVSEFIQSRFWKIDLHGLKIDDLVKEQLGK